MYPWKHFSGRTGSGYLMKTPIGEFKIQHDDDNNWRVYRDDVSCCGVLSDFYEAKAAADEIISAFKAEEREHLEKLGKERLKQLRYYWDLQKQVRNNNTG